MKATDQNIKKCLANPGRPHMNNIENTLSEPDFDPQSYQREFAVCTLDYGEAVIMPAIMERIIAESPRIRVRIVHRRIYSISEILDGTADVLLGTVPDNPPKHCVVQPLYDDRYVCLMHKSHPMAERTLTLEDYVRYPHSIVHTGESPSTTIDDQLTKMGLSRTVVKRSPHFVASILAIGDSHIIQTIPQRLAEKITHHSDLVMKELPLDVGPVRVGMMWHMRDAKDPAHIWFRGVIKETVID